MWENTRKKAVIRNVIIGLLLIVAVCMLVGAFLRVQARIAAEDQKLSEIKTSQQRQLSEAREENIEAIQKAYEADMDAVAAYMPGIVCWGDSLTSGSSGNAAYPYTLQKYINTYLCNIYDFRSSVPNAANYTWLDWDDYTVSIPVINMGSGQEDTATILGRAGVVPYAVKTAFTIPAETKSIPIVIESSNGKPVMPLTAGNAGVNPVTIAGVEGTLTLETENLTRTYYFRRLTPGEAVDVKAGAEILTASASEYQNYIHIVWLGTYDGLRSANDLVQDVKRLLARQTKNTERYLVLGPCTYGGSWSTYGNSNLDAIDSAMMQSFGSNYVNIRKYLIEDGLSDGGISPSRLDTQYLAGGNVPDSFRSAAGGADLTGKAYELIGKLVYERMDRLGFFAEIREELGIDKTAQELLENNPQYFENMLKIG